MKACIAVAFIILVIIGLIAGAGADVLDQHYGTGPKSYDDTDEH